MAKTSRKVKRKFFKPPSVGSWVRSTSHGWEGRVVRGVTEEDRINPKRVYLQVRCTIVDKTTNKGIEMVLEDLVSRWTGAPEPQVPNPKR